MLDGSRVEADAWVVALGSYSPLLLRPLGISLGIYPVKGYSVTIPTGAAHCAPTVSLTDEAHKLVFSRLGDRLRVAGTAELAGYDTSLSAARCEVILNRVFELLPHAGDRSRAELWTGLRPAMPGNVPAIGRTRYRNLFLNTGHGTLGWTLACGSGHALAEIMSGRRPGIDSPVPPVAHRHVKSCCQSSRGHPDARCRELAGETESTAPFEPRPDECYRHPQRGPGEPLRPCRAAGQGRCRPGILENLTERARRTLFFARYEAARSGSAEIGSEHLLLGLLREDKSLATRFLPKAQASVDSIRKEIEGRTLFITGCVLPDGGTLLVLRDVTALRRLEHVRRDFVANVSHELKTPLTSIVGYAETLASDSGTGAQARGFAETILGNARRMQRLVDDLLDLSRIESGGWHPVTDILELEPALQDAWAPFAERARSAGIAFDLVVAPESHALPIDPDALRQILTNLFANALRHTAAGGRIRAGAELVQDSVRLFVSDTGSGIAAEHLPRIFERFYRVDPGRSREQGGTGLFLDGLS